jgi:hypothetical protein
MKPVPGDRSKDLKFKPDLVLKDTPRQDRVVTAEGALQAEQDIGKRLFLSLAPGRKGHPRSGQETGHSGPPSCG